MLHFASSFVSHQPHTLASRDFTGRVKDDSFDSTEESQVMDFLFDSPYGSPSWDSPQLPPQPPVLDLDTNLSGTGKRTSSECHQELARFLSSDCERVAKLQRVTLKQHPHSAPASIRLQPTKSRSADNFLDSEPVLLADNNDLSSTATSSSAYSANDLIELARKLIAIENEPECNCGEC